METADLAPHQSYRIAELHRRVLAIELGTIAARFTRRVGAPVSETEQLLDRYRKWLTLRGAYGSTVVPVLADVDPLWHDHILHTERYAADCESVFGVFLHHAPGADIAPASRTAAVARLEELWREHFHEELGSSMLAECD